MCPLSLLRCCSDGMKCRHLILDFSALQILSRGLSFRTLIPWRTPQQVLAVLQTWRADLPLSGCDSECTKDLSSCPIVISLSNSNYNANSTCCSHFLRCEGRRLHISLSPTYSQHFFAPPLFVQPSSLLTTTTGASLE